MAGVMGHKALTQGLFQNVLAQEKAMLTDVQEAALEAGIAGLDAMRERIDTVESALRPGKIGRNWTYKMRRSTDVDVRRNGNTTTIRVGWLVTKEDYFTIQEHGQGSIWAMNSLMDGHAAILDTLKGWGLKT
jgi:hypothetical protein